VTGAAAYLGLTILVITLTSPESVRNILGDTRTHIFNGLMMYKPPPAFPKNRKHVFRREVLR
jgi:hypothetical protein